MLWPIAYINTLKYYVFEHLSKATFRALPTPTHQIYEIIRHFTKSMGGDNWLVLDFWGTTLVLITLHPLSHLRQQTTLHCWELRRALRSGSRDVELGWLVRGEGGGIDRATSKGADIGWLVGEAAAAFSGCFFGCFFSRWNAALKLGMSYSSWC